MGRAAQAVANFCRLAFWPLSASLLFVLLLQPLYYLSLGSLGVLSSDRIAQHIGAAFEQGILSDNGNPRGLIWKGGEQLTECISFGVGLNKAETSWQAAITGSFPQFGDAHACTGLHRAVTGQDTPWQPYFRYWHGYRVILAPLAAAFPIWLVKLVNVLLLVAAGILFWRTLRSRCGETVATVLLITFVCLSDVLFIWRTSTHALSLVYILAGASLFAAGLRRNWTPAALVLAAAALGSVFNFIDFLINPPMMPMLLAFFILLSERRDAGLLTIAVVLAWFFGYAETWLARWGLAYLAMPSSAGVAADVFATAKFRMVGSYSGVELLPLAATVRAFLRALNRVGVVIPIIIAIAVAHYAATVSRIDWKRVLWLSSPVIIAMLWFEALSNHTQIHLTPSSRSAAMALAIALSAAVITMPRRPSIAELYAQLALLRAKLPLFRLRRAR